MKKILVIGLLSSLLLLMGCNTPTQKIDSKTDSKTKIEEPKPEKEYLQVGEVFVATDDRGTYEIKVTEAKYLGIHEADEQKQQRVQVTWEVNNLSFKGFTIINDIQIDNVVAFDSSSLKIKDPNDYILDEMSTGWDGDWMNHYKTVGIGEKIIHKHTWILNDENTEYVTVSYDRMLDKEFKIKIDR